jgi:hypothetical protein
MTHTARRWTGIGLTLSALAATNISGQSCRTALQPVPLAAIPEASGIAVSQLSPGLLWTHNDTSEPVVFAIRASGEVQGRTRLAGVQRGDWEAVSVGPCAQGTCLFIGDIGDNSARRRSLSVYRVPESEAMASGTANAEVMRLTFPDGPQDAEALFVTGDGVVHVVTKGEHGPVTLYRAGTFRSGASVELQRIALVTATRSNGRPGVSGANKVTDASVSPNGRWIAIRTRGAVVFYAAAELTAGTVRQVFRHDLRPLGEIQGEGVAFDADGTLWLTSEGGGKSRAGSLARLACSLP